jgi:cytidine deaminase
MDQKLFAAAKTAFDRAHAPYSKFHVGTALRTLGGSEHAGANVENASYPEGWCAETSAIAAMIAASADPAHRRIAEAVVVAERIGGRVTTPCGGCRQRLAEFSGPDTVITCSDPSGRSETFRMSDLLPGAFSLGVSDGA